MFFYTYILKSLKDNNQYVGYTEDLNKRIEKHKKGLVLATKHRRPLKLIYFEACLNKQDAKQREIYLKSTYGRRWLGKRLLNYKR